MYADVTVVNGSVLALAIGGVEAVAADVEASEAAVVVPFDASVEEPGASIGAVGIECISLEVSRFADRAPVFAAPRSSSGGSPSIGAPGAPAGGGNGDDDGLDGPKEMSANAVCCDLLSLKMGRRPALLPREFDFLLARGLVERMSPEEYDRNARAVRNLSLVEDKLGAAMEDLGRLYEQRMRLEREQDSIKHRLFRFFNGVLGRGRDDDAGALGELDGRIAAKWMEIKKAASSFEELRDRKKHLERLVDVEEWGYLGLTEAGKRMLKLLRKHIEFTNNLSLSEFEDVARGMIP